MLAYDGTGFHGWQVQPGRVTVQGELRAALLRVTGEDVLPQGSGRTDAGVHAEGQIASCVLAAPIPEENLARALNRTLPAAIRVLCASREHPAFHARHSAIAKTYEYRIYRGELCPPWQAPYAYAWPAPLQLEAMQKAAARIRGTHDFTAFAATDPDRTRRASLEAATDARGNTRTVTTSQWIEDTVGHRLLYRVRGDGFLHHMVRNLVGTFLEVGRGAMDETYIDTLLATRSRSLAGATAPARGLFLMSVEYPEAAPGQR